MQGLMEGKRGLIMGVANDHSIAWGIAKTVAAHGAKLAFTFQNIAVYTREVFFHDVRDEPLVDRDDDAYQLAAVGDGECLTGAGGLPDHRPGQFADPDRLGFQLGRAGRVV